MTIGTILMLIVIALATFAATYEIRDTDGPFDIFYNLRRKLNIVHDGYEDIEYADEQTGFWGSLVACWWCLSTWVSAFWTLLALALSKLSLTDAPFVWFASITLAGLVWKVIERKE